MDTKELAAQLAEAIRTSLKQDLEQIRGEIKELRKDINRLTERIDDVSTTNAFLAKDVYMLKNKAK